MTFNIDLSDMRRERFGQMGMRAAMAFLLFGVGGALMAPGSAVYDIVALAGGGVAAGGMFALERAVTWRAAAASRWPRSASWTS